ncbi:MAG: zinc-ribbon domain-containing protein [Alphaproteobacteria bacterium]|nr:zinc-ribbon domain-containing protein [Alphaproteobacteria bacterium]
MYCKKCGKELRDDAVFCIGCGTKVEGANINTVQLRCKACNGVMDIRADSKVMECPYCGSREVIIESDDVAIEKIKSQTHKEIELKKMENEEKISRTQEEKEMLTEFKKGKFSKFLIICAVISFLMCYTQLSDGAILSGIIALVQGGLYTVSWLMGMQVIKSEKKHLYILLAVIGLALIIPFLGTGDIKSSNKYEWGKGGYYDVVPKPKTEYGTLYEMEDRLSVYAEKINENEYRDYVSQCKEKGFTVEITEKTDSYEAYNDEGYKLKLSYDRTSKKMSLSVDAPVENNTISWPSKGLASLLPAPKSKIGEVRIDSSSQYLAYICDTSYEEYNKYVETCTEKGFDVDYSKGDDYYYADNEKGDSLALNYEGNDTMRVSIYASEDEPTKAPTLQEPEATKKVESTKTPEKTKEPVKTEKPKEEDELINGMRPAFKESMDEYEEFFDEYCEFMDKVANNPDDLSLMLDYGDFMSQYTETMEAFEKMGEEDMNDAEMQYYIEVSGRITEKLYKIAS